MPILFEDWLYQPCTAFLFVHVLWAVIVLRAHEPLSLGLGYKQLNVIPLDKRGLLCSEEVSTVCTCFSSGYHLFFLFSFPPWLLFAVICMCIFGFFCYYLLSSNTACPSFRLKSEF